MSQTPIFHGSDLEQIASYYHIESDEICCFSANVNPLGFPEQTALAVCKNFSHLMSRYPDRNYIGLRAAIGRYCHISPDYVSVGNGSTELDHPTRNTSGNYSFRVSLTLPGFRKRKIISGFIPES